jgi:hypothetical protein
MLRVTAGATYDASKHQDVPVNSEKPIDITSDHVDAKLHMRIKDYRGIYLSTRIPRHQSLTQPRPPQRLPRDIPLLLHAPAPL